MILVYCRTTIHIGQENKKDMRNRVSWIIVKLPHQTSTRRPSWSILLRCTYLCGLRITKKPVGRGLTGTTITPLMFSFRYISNSLLERFSNSSIEEKQMASLLCMASIHLVKNSADSHSCNSVSVWSLVVAWYQTYGVYNPSSRSICKKPAQSPW